jgi:hypothetical protein
LSIVELLPDHDHGEREEHRVDRAQRLEVVACDLVARGEGVAGDESPHEVESDDGESDAASDGGVGARRMRATRRGSRMKSVYGWNGVRPESLLAGHRRRELGVALGLPHLVEKELHRLHFKRGESGFLSESRSSSEPAVA